MRLNEITQVKDLKQCPYVFMLSKWQVSIEAGFFLSLFILREKERTHKWVRGRERERESHPIGTEPNMGLSLTNYEIMT